MKKITSILLALVLVLSFAACSNNSDNSASTANSTTSVPAGTQSTDDEINKILVLDIKERDYFTSRNAPNEHGGGELFAEDDAIMSWLFSEH